MGPFTKEDFEPNFADFEAPLAARLANSRFLCSDGLLHEPKEVIEDHELYAVGTAQYRCSKCLCEIEFLAARAASDE